MELFGSLDPFVSRLIRINVLSALKMDAVDA